MAVGNGSVKIGLASPFTSSGADELLLCIVPLRLCIADVSRLARLASLGSLGGPGRVHEVLSWIMRAAERAERSEASEAAAMQKTKEKPFPVWFRRGRVFSFVSALHVLVVVSALHVLVGASGHACMSTAVATSSGGR